MAIPSEKQRVGYAIMRLDPNSDTPVDVWFVVDGSEEDAKMFAEDEAAEELKAADSLVTKPAGQTANAYLKELMDVEYTVESTMLVSR